MTIYEEYAQQIIMKAYNNGGELPESQAWDEYGKPNEAVLKGSNYLLCIYGEFDSFLNVGTVYKLSKEGVEFARKGAFKGEEDRLNEELKRNKETRRIAIAGLIIAVIVAVIQAYAIFNGLCF